MVGRIKSVVAFHEHGRVGINAEEVGGAFDPLDLILCELGQTGPGESLLLAEVVDAVDHLLWVVSFLREYGMRKPSKLKGREIGSEWVTGCYQCQLT